MAELTEKKLLSMPKNAYMNPDQLDFFNKKLEDLKQSTGQHIEEVKTELANQEREFDDCDRAFQEEEHALQLRIIDREANLFRKIDLALQRIEDQTYGYCDETGDEIGLERLLLRPTATLSIDAKSLMEEAEQDYANDHDDTD